MKTIRKGLWVPALIDWFQRWMPSTIMRLRLIILAKSSQYFKLSSFSVKKANRYAIVVIVVIAIHNFESCLSKKVRYRRVSVEPMHKSLNKNSCSVSLFTIKEVTSKPTLNMVCNIWLLGETCLLISYSFTLSSLFPKDIIKMTIVPIKLNKTFTSIVYSLPISTPLCYILIF